jgi:hypothetical protein
METVFKYFAGYRACFKPRSGSAPSITIEWDVNSSEPFGECKEYDYLGTYVRFDAKRFV